MKLAGGSVMDSESGGREIAAVTVFAGRSASDWASEKRQRKGKFQGLGTTVLRACGKWKRVPRPFPFGLGLLVLSPCG